MPPWFYERRFLRPRRLRQPSLRALRFLSSAGRLPAAAPSREATLERVATDVLVVGAGPAGLAAAAEIAGSDRRVLVLERAAEPGGSARGWPGRADALSPLLETVEVRTATTCLGVYADEMIAAAVGPRGPIEIAFEAIVVATGAYDRNLLFGGNDLPGIIGGRAFERYARQGAFATGARVGVFAATREAARIATAGAEAGVELAWMAGPGDVPDVGTSSFPGTTIALAVGRRRIREVELVGAGAHACDVLVLGFSQPSYEVQMQLGARGSVRGVPPVVVPERLSANALVVGEAAGQVDPASIAVLSRERTSGWLAGRTPDDPEPPPMIRDPSRRHPDAFVCFCEDVRVRDVEDAVRDGFASSELVKRRTGASTGACQGRLCLGPLLGLLEEVGARSDLPTSRPPIAPTRLASLAADG